MGTIVVTAAIIRHNGKFLIAQRKKEADQGLKWEFPGGKLEAGESPEVCLAREIREELNMEIEVGSIFRVVSHTYKDKHVILLCYYCNVVHGAPQIIDCQDFRWVTVDEMSDFEFAPADIAVVKALQELSE